VVVVAGQRAGQRRTSGAGAMVHDDGSQIFRRPAAVGRGAPAAGHHLPPLFLF
ncbi:hypothetical protein A2U01_0076303, partial [Trifolium medium]|nr:hypothetical protein [Trifolium medium]